MKKQYKFESLDCANCAAKMEAAIQKVDGVTSASVNFMAQKLTLDADENRLEEILKECVRICKKVEPHCGLQV